MKPQTMLKDGKWKFAALDCTYMRESERDTKIYCNDIDKKDFFYILELNLSLNLDFFKVIFRLKILTKKVFEILLLE